jgi:hypothetical protein
MAGAGNGPTRSSLRASFPSTPVESRVGESHRRKLLVAEFVCGVREKDPKYLSACKNLRQYQDTGYCVLHFPGEEKKEDFEQAIVYSLGAVARLNPEPRPTEPGLFQFLVIVEGLLGPLQIALLALAVRRKVMQ